MLVDGVCLCGVRIDLDLRDGWAMIIWYSLEEHILRLKWDKREHEDHGIKAQFAARALGWGL